MAAVSAKTNAFMASSAFATAKRPAAVQRGNLQVLAQGEGGSAACLDCSVCRSVQQRMTSGRIAQAAAYGPLAAYLLSVDRRVMQGEQRSMQALRSTLQPAHGVQRSL